MQEAISPDPVDKQLPGLTLLLAPKSMKKWSLQLLRPLRADWLGPVPERWPAAWLARSGSVAAKLRKSCSPSKTLAADCIASRSIGQGRRAHSEPETEDKWTHGKPGTHRSLRLPSGGHEMTPVPFLPPESGWTAEVRG